MNTLSGILQNNTNNSNEPSDGDTLQEHFSAGMDVYSLDTLVSMPTEGFEPELPGFVPPATGTYILTLDPDCGNVRQNFRTIGDDSSKRLLFQLLYNIVYTISVADQAEDAEAQIGRTAQQAIFFPNDTTADGKKGFGEAIGRIRGITNTVTGKKIQGLPLPDLMEAQINVFFAAPIITKEDKNGVPRANIQWHKARTLSEDETNQIRALISQEPTSETTEEAAE